MSGLNTLPKPERKTSISSVKSREQLLEGEADYFAHEMRTMKQRRTKIIATMCEAVSSVDDIKGFLKAGMDIIRVNMAYCNQKTLEIIMKNKAIVEKELGCFIPILLDLKGTTLRLGSFDVPAGEISLKKGDEFRVTTNKKIKGNQHVIACDCSDLGKLLRVGDRLLVDYGRDVLVVKRIEKENETILALREKYPMKFDKCLLPKKLNNFRSFSHGDTPFTTTLGSEEDGTEESMKSKDSLEEKDISLDKPEASDKTTTDGKISQRRKFEFAFKKKKKAEKDVIVCEAESDCIIQSAKPVFIHQKQQEKSEDLLEPEGQSYCFYMEENQEDISCFPVKDIKDLNLASKLEVDSVAITGVRSRKDVEEARFILGAKNHVKIITKIQNASALEKFDEILEASDGIIIARNYLSLHIPVEKLFFKQKEMIRKCHEACKPVTIVSQVLESMVRALVPTTSEINDIANLILDGIDSITLVTETTYGLHKKESLETLSRICFEIEYNEVLNRQRMLAELNSFHHTPNHTQTDSFNSNHIQYMPKFDLSPFPSISHTVASCAIKAVYDLRASLVIAFTQTGSTVLKLSKMRSPCPIIAVTISEMVARQVSLLASVTAVKVGSMYGKEGLTQKVLSIAKEKNWVKIGDFIVITCGDIEGVTGSTNSLKVIKVTA